MVNYTCGSIMILKHRSSKHSRGQVEEAISHTPHRQNQLPAPTNHPPQSQPAWKLRSMSPSVPPPPSLSSNSQARKLPAMEANCFLCLEGIRYGAQKAEGQQWDGEAKGNEGRWGGFQAGGSGLVGWFVKRRAGRGQWGGAGSGAALVSCDPKH